MSITARSPYEDPESSATKWVAIFILLSLLAHAVIIATILLITPGDKYRSSLGTPARPGA